MFCNDVPKITIVDYGLGNLFSVKQACLITGMHATITNNKKEIINSDAIILPGVGAFRDAIKNLRKLDLVEILREIALTKPFIGICLGMQLLMSESYEFGLYKGLDIIKGKVIRFENPVDNAGKLLKVPHIGWNRVNRNEYSINKNEWRDSLLKGLKNGEFMYFVHSFYVKPDDSSIILSMSNYGNIEFCSSIKHKNIFACQFHPERSSSNGLKIYQNLKNNILKNK
jgi:glutamine amidotransferase